MTNYYDYNELKARVLSADATNEDFIKMIEWFDRYDSADFNGEYYDLDSYRLFPIYDEIEEDVFEVVGGEIR